LREEPDDAGRGLGSGPAGVIRPCQSALSAGRRGGQGPRGPGGDALDDGAQAEVPPIAIRPRPVRTCGQPGLPASRAGLAVDGRV